MTVDFGQGVKHVFYAYQPPDVSTFYNETEGSRVAKEPLFTGMFGKFINHSPETIRVFWDSGKPNDAPTYISDVEPFGAAGTATYPGHQFFAATADDTVLQRWTIVSTTSLYYYDPFDSPQQAQKQLDAQQFALYQMQLMNQFFAQRYREVTGTDWLALYQQKLAPRYHMWRADALGQSFEIPTKEIHFVELPDEKELQRGTSPYGPRPDERAKMRRHRDKYPSMTLNMTVLSCSPRVFEIPNFLSDVEVEHILNVAGRMNLKQSTTQSGSSSRKTTDSRTRTSSNSWIARNTDLVIDAIYRRAADLLQIDEALLRWRRATEIPEFTESTISISERLQLVHYGPGQQYTPHHDFAMPGLVNYQPSRFATILFYLNDDMTGGETSFPRWLNAETPHALKVKPEKGKAILFYNLLPDGNYDERSMHAALPVVDGEKWLTNLWLWDPLLDHTAAAHF